MPLSHSLLRLHLHLDYGVLLLLGCLHLFLYLVLLH